MVFAIVLGMPHWNRILKGVLKWGKKIYICFDTEIEAQKIAMAQAQQIWCCPTEVIELNNFNDPGELSEEEGLILMKQLVWGDYVQE